ncbi:hypothetical protein BGX23_008161 [Mortierella sp. AD031]|nr:hypothetical protein BGX23_008161 [Mortierella sp. AD031]KAG0199612.1 hypothetical protein BGX33_011540 [Mortierella sp. NVP41]
MKITALSVAALFITPTLAAKTWDVNFVSGRFSPEVLNIAPGDSVRWPNNDDADHAIVQTNNGARTCNKLSGDFNSGRKTKGQIYQRIFPTAGSVNYKDGIGANCIKGAVGTINVGTTGNGSATATATASVTAAPITSPTNRPNAGSYLTPEASVFLGAAAFIGALVL